MIVRASCMLTGGSAFSRSVAGRHGALSQTAVPILSSASLTTAPTCSSVSVGDAGVVCASTLVLKAANARMQNKKLFIEGPNPKRLAGRSASEARREGELNMARSKFLPPPQPSSTWRIYPNPRRRRRPPARRCGSRAGCCAASPERSARRSRRLARKLLSGKP